MGVVRRTDLDAGSGTEDGEAAFTGPVGSVFDRFSSVALRLSSTVQYGTRYPRSH